MSISSIDAGKTLCELSDWEMSNLRLQKVLYIAHMYHLGLCEGEPLINDGFQAWDYGPVAPELYHHAKGFGADFVHNVFHAYKGADEGRSEHRLLKQAYEATKEMTEARLVGITHWEKGAWQKVYRPGVRWISIPDKLILQEYFDRTENITEEKVVNE